VTVASFEGKTPQLGDGCWVHPSAEIFGDVTLGARCWTGPGARAATTALSRPATAAPWRTAQWSTPVPARLLEREVADAYHANWRRFKQTSVDLCARYASGYGRW